MPPIKRFIVTSQFVERVNYAMISGKDVVVIGQKQPARVRAIIANTKQSESEMRSKFADAVRAVEVTA